MKNLEKHSFLKFDTEEMNRGVAQKTYIYFFFFQNDLLRAFLFFLYFRLFFDTFF